MTTQCDSTPRGASWKPTPITSPLGNTGGLKVVMSPLAMLSTSSCHWFGSVSSSTAQRTARAAWRPMVECRASSGDLGPGDRADTVSSGLVAYFLVGSWPAASMLSTCASGPTCAGLP